MRTSRVREYYITRRKIKKQPKEDGLVGEKIKENLVRKYNYFYIERLYNHKCVVLSCVGGGGSVAVQSQASVQVLPGQHQSTVSVPGSEL